MANHNLTDLLPDWHPVPTGGVIRKDERYAIVEADGRDISIFTTDADWSAPADDRILTEHPVTPPLPTEEGATIIASCDAGAPFSLLTREGRHDTTWPVSSITSWAPVTIGETVVMP